MCVNFQREWVRGFIGPNSMSREKIYADLVGELTVLISRMFRQCEYSKVIMRMHDCQACDEMKQMKSAQSPTFT